MAFILAQDATHENIAHLPAGHQAAGYTTGTPPIQWTAADWEAHPGAVRIDQSPVLTAIDETSDVLDVENGAATPAECATWYKAALANFEKTARAGQRRPALYVNQSNVTPVANALIAGGVPSGPKLWIANWNDTTAEAIAAIAAASGPFPVIGIQYASGQFTDFDVFSETWLNDVSRVPTPTVGPYLHHLGLLQTFGSAALARNTTIQELLELSVAHYTSDDHKRLHGTHAPGFPYYTVNP
jgi:hypothetical protein